MSGLTHLRDEIVERSASLLDEASHLAERGAHSAARLAEDQASSLRSALPRTLPVVGRRRRRTPSLAARSTRLGLVSLVVVAVAATYLWRAKRHTAATTEHLDVDEASQREPTFAGATRLAS